MMLVTTSLPVAITTEDQLDDALTIPSPALVEFMRRLDGDFAILGIAGKMGATLGGAAVRAIRQAAVKKTVYGVARFSDPASRARIAGLGIEAIAADLLDPSAVAALPRVANVVFMAGRKFGTEEGAALTWAINALVPAHVAAHFASSRIVAFSTGCVYPLVAATGSGCAENHPPAPVGEYAQSCLGRERIFEHFSRVRGTPVCLIRLNYAIDLRYGVLHDIARRIWAEAPVDLTVPCFNAIWQGDAAHHALLALERCASPPAIINVTGRERIGVRQVARELARHMSKSVAFTGDDGPVAYLSDAGRAARLFGPPRVPLACMIRWTAEWVMSGGRSLELPTHFEINSGRF
jgi:nucleoside-diphosphate-sugar epimerase